MASSRGTKGKVVVSGILFWYPLAGVTYQFLHYLIGLRRLGYDPYYIEDSSRYVYDPNINDLSPDARSNVATVAPILESYGFGDRWGYQGFGRDGQVFGIGPEPTRRLYQEAAALLNVTGAQEIRDEHRLCRKRIYIESDPFASQVLAANGDRKIISAFNDHDALFTFGENIGAADCAIPVGSYRWLPTRQPVALELWERPPGDTPLTYRTITTWSNKGKNVVYGGDTYYWTKDREFLRFVDLPQQRPAAFELATNVDDNIRQLLTGHRWLLADPLRISRDIELYRRYIQDARAEFTVARDQYVRPNTGWFSDRSACYLAAGRPVITQETGFSKYIPSGKGLYGFRTIEDILSAVDAIESDYPGNCQAAKEIAAEYCQAEKVIGSVMERSGL